MPATSCGFSNPYTLTLRGPSVAVEIGIDPAFQPGLGLRPFCHRTDSKLWWIRERWRVVLMTNWR